jgi:hypothetical protein
MATDLNYLKVSGARRPSDFFVFRTQEEFSAAHDAARRVQPKGVLAVYRPLTVMPDGYRCIGHAPMVTGVGAWRCANCNQVGYDRIS